METSPVVSKHQTFQVERVHRSQLKPHPENPRILDKTARKRLRDSIKRDGLVETPVWNKRTGHLVGAHQRLSVMDELEKTQDYYVDVAVVDLDEVRERELLVRLNNQSVMGSWDLDGLSNLLQVPDLNIEATGWDQTELALILPDLKLPDLPFQQDNTVTGPDEATIREMKENRQKHKDRQAGVDNSEFYFAVAFADSDELNYFCERSGLDPQRRFQDGEVVANVLGFSLKERLANGQAEQEQQS